MLYTRHTSGYNIIDSDLALVICERYRILACMLLQEWKLANFFLLLHKPTEGWIHTNAKTKNIKANTGSRRYFGWLFPLIILA